MRGIKCPGLQPAHTWKRIKSKRAGSRRQKRKSKAKASGLKEKDNILQSMFGGSVPYKRNASELAILCKCNCGSMITLYIHVISLSYCMKIMRVESLK